MKIINSCLTISLYALLLLTTVTTMLGGDSTPESEVVKWSYVYEAKMLPSDDESGWKHHSNDSGSSVITNGVLVLTSTTQGIEYWQLDGVAGDSTWDGSKPSTVEFKMRVTKKAEGSDKAAHIVIADGKKYYHFPFDDDSWHTYRVTLSDGMARLCVDDQPDTFSVSGGSQFAPESDHALENRKNFIYFGDGSAGIGGVSEWRSFRWTNKGAFPPQSK